MERLAKPEGPSRFDVVVCGGGLAGLTVARQLRREIPEASVAVVEKTRRPLPDACHKVGESSVELGSDYFSRALGLDAYLREHHLLKNGLRFICGDSRGPLAERPEIGPGEFPVVPSFQLDRGKLENDLRRMCEQDAVTLWEGWSVRDVTLSEGDSPHRVLVTSEEDGAERELCARWVVDATGRRRLLQKKLGLGRKSPHEASAAWFRIAERIKVGELVPPDDKPWHARDVDDMRWLSTVHLMGPGYWVWLIPLSTGYTSVGIVADTAFHDFSTFSKPERAIAWIREHEPHLARRLEGLEMADFRVMRDYSYLSDRTMSPDRWACVGEAAVFVDPLLSPGSDFIALSNSFAVRVIQDDLRGRYDAAVIEELNDIYEEACGDAIRTLSHNGAIFPHGKVFGAKMWWDFFNYWSYVSTCFVQGLFRLPLEDLKRFRHLGRRFFELNDCAQRLVLAWAELQPTPHSGKEGYIPLPMFPSVLADKHLSLHDRLSPAETCAQMERDLATGEEFVSEMLIHALRDLGPERAAALGERAGVTRWAFRPDPARIEADALPRRERRDRLPRVSRDLERALGRPKGDEPLAELISTAFGAETIPPSVGEPARPLATEPRVR